jgi:enoyl-CoA hydratase
MMPEYSTILIEIRGRVGLMRLNRPQAMNALNNILLREIGDGLHELDANPDIGVIVITGNERAFAAGADIREMADATLVEMYLREHGALYDRVRQVKKPLVAAVSGWCLGGGNEIALTCDMIIASETARFGQPEISIGVIPGAGGTQRLAHAVGKAISMEMVLNNRTLTADEALRYGLVNRVVPVDRYLDEALALAEEIAARAPFALRLAKEAINNAFETSLSRGIADEQRAFFLLFATQDQKEGMTAFLEKRKPQWKGF